jgi:hypothetical protein
VANELAPGEVERGHPPRRRALRVKLLHHRAQVRGQHLGDRRLVTLGTEHEGNVGPYPALAAGLGEDGEARRAAHEEVLPVADPVLVLRAHGAKLTGYPDQPPALVDQLRRPAVAIELLGKLT